MNLAKLEQHRPLAWRCAMGCLALASLLCTAQAQPGGGRNRDRFFDPVLDGFPGFGPGRGGGPGGMGGVQEKYPLVAKFDKNKDQRLDSEERQAAREFIQQEKAAGRGPRLPGGPMRRNVNLAPPPAGPQRKPSEVPSRGDKPLYDLFTLRTLFLQFDNPDWEQELEDFYQTDVEVPAQLVVDGRTYREVGVHFRGASSYFMVPRGYKRSLNVSLDHAHADQRLLGYRTLNLLNSHTDPSYLRTVLYFYIARQYLPAPEANLVEVVIHGESWGIYINVEQFNKDFVHHWFGSSKGARWKVPGSPRGQGGLEYLGDSPEPYKKIYEIKSKDDPASWQALIRLCRVLNQTPPEKLEAELAPLLDLDGVLKFLALENVFINNDGYWTRASDYNLYLDEKGRFHLVPYDGNETFRPAQGFGLRAAAANAGQGVELSPLAGADDARKPLLNKLLAVPALRQRYLQYVREIATRWLDWKQLEPTAQRLHNLIADVVKSDTRKLENFQVFARSLDYESSLSALTAPEPGRFGPGRGGGPPLPEMSLKTFVVKRRVFLLETFAEPSAPDR